MSVLTKQQRIAEMAKRSPQMGFTSLAYLMDIDWLQAAFHRTRKDGAPGVDGLTWSEYAKNLEANLQSLLDRAKSGTYRAPPVRRVYIPKAGSTTETRPIGIPTLEDKVLQRAVVMLLEPIYEQDFDAGSYGFRPGRSAHDALEDLWKRTMDSGGGWVLEVDIRKFFDTLDHAHLREFLQIRIRDGVLKRLIGKWLKTLRQVRPDASPRQDPAGSLSPSALQGERHERCSSPEAGNIRSAGFHPLLGPDSAGRMGGEATDGLEAIEPCGAEHR